MICSKCGAYVSKNAQVCPICRIDLILNPPENPDSTPTTVTPDQFEMRWYKFLTYFALFACAALDMLTAVFYLFIGIIFTAVPQLDPLRYFYLFMSLPSLFCAGFAIVTWFYLIGYHKKAPHILNVFLISNALLNIPFLCAVCIPPFLFVFIIPSIIYIIVSYNIIRLNAQYFQNRIALFTK